MKHANLILSLNTFEMPFKIKFHSAGQVLAEMSYTLPFWRPAEHNARKLAVQNKKTVF